MVQALPDDYLLKMNGIDMIIGQPLLFNYYTIFDVYNARIGFYEAIYTRKSEIVTTGASGFIVVCCIIVFGALFACYKKFKAEKEKICVTVKPRSEINQERLNEEQRDWDHELIKQDMSMQENSEI